jgi:hypothetical protein
MVIDTTAAANVELIDIDATHPQTWANTDILNVTFEVPIAEWAGNGTVNLGPGAQVEYVWNSSTADSSDTTSFAYGPSGVAIGAFTTANRNKRVRFQYPIQVTDQITVELRDTNNVWIDATQSLGVSLSATTGISLVNVAGTTDLDVSFGSAGYGNTVRTTSGTWGGLAGTWSWRVKKFSPSAPVGFGLASATETGLISTTTQPIAGVKTFSSNPVVSGGGVQFPATQVPSADANCLDDYEEGTWTPTITGSTGLIGTASYNSRSGTYTKIGRQVFVEGYVDNQTFGSWTGNLLISGLPFTVKTSTYPGCNIALWSGASTNVMSVCGYADGGTTNVAVRGQTAAAGNNDNLTISQFAGTMDIYFSCTYEV